VVLAHDRYQVALAEPSVSRSTSIRMMMSGYGFVPSVECLTVFVPENERRL
jgi:hypothetical protein